MTRKITKLLVSSALALSLISNTTYAAGTKAVDSKASKETSAVVTSTKEAHAEKNSSEKVDGESTAPSLKISGFTSVNISSVSQKNRSNGKGTGYHIANDVSDLFFIISGKNQSDLTYKYQLTLEAIPGESLSVEQNFIELQKGITVQIGATAGFERSGLQDGSRLLGGNGGFSGTLDRVFNFSSGVFNGYRALGDSKYATKIVVWSPQWEGIRVAFGFTPNTAHIGDKGLNTAGTSGKIKSPGNSKGIYPHTESGPFGVHHTTFGMNYNRDIGDWNFKMSAVGIFDRSYVVNTTGSTYLRTRVRDTKSYQLGGIIGYGKYQVGGGWLDNGKSRLPYDGNLTIKDISMGDTWKGNAGKAWNIAANYTHGAYKFAIGHQSTFRKTDAVNRATSNITSATFGVTPLQGMKLYVEADYIKTKTNAGSTALANKFNAKESQLINAIGNNKGIVTLTGITLSF